MNVVQFPASEKTFSTKGQFFAVDRRTWGVVCGSAKEPGLGINAAFAYLLLARGSDKANRITPWSVKSLEDRGLSRGRAKKAIEALLGRGVIKQVGFGGKLTRYELLPAADVPGTDPSKVAADEPKPKKSEAQAAFHARYLDWQARMADAYEPDWIWLPNELVDGTKDGGDIPPVELMRQTQDPLCMRLLADLYHASNLAENGGIHWRSMRTGFERKEIGRHGPFVVWGFKRLGETCWGLPDYVAPHHTGKKVPHRTRDGKDEQRDAGWDDFFRRFGMLHNLGLVQIVPHVLDADTEEAEIIHPYGWPEGEALERSIAIAATEAGKVMLTTGQVEWARANGYNLCPVPSHITNVAMAGIVRLRYRPKTAATAAWWANLNEAGQETLERFRTLQRGVLESRKSTQAW